MRQAIKKAEIKCWGNRNEGKRKARPQQGERKGGERKVKGDS